MVQFNQLGTSYWRIQRSYRIFWGKELAVTTGAWLSGKRDWMHLAQQLNRYHASGLVINVGQYIYEVPEELKAYCDEMTFAADCALGSAFIRYDKRLQYSCIFTGYYR